LDKKRKRERERVEIEAEIRVKVPPPPITLGCEKEISMRDIEEFLELGFNCLLVSEVTLLAILVLTLSDTILRYRIVY